MSMDEIWKDIEGWEGYQVSNLGNVRSLDRWTRTKGNSMRLCKGRMLKTEITKNGYLLVKLYKNDKTKSRFVHRLVAEAFLEIPEELKKYIGTRKLQVNHINEFDKTDNRAENLEWMSANDNCNYGTRTQRMVEKQINHPNKSKKVYQYTLDNQLVKVWESTQECGRNGFERRNILHCCKGECKTYKGFRWSYTPLEAPND